MSEHRYDAGALRADLVRALGGLALTGGPLLLVPVQPFAGAILGALAGLFGIYGLRTLARGRMVFELSQDAIGRKGMSTFGLRDAKVRWADLSTIKLRYYSTRRTREGGWMQLTLKSEQATIRVESTLEDFDRVAAEAARVAAGLGLEASPSTVSNFAALGISYGAEPAGQPNSREAQNRQ